MRWTSWRRTGAYDPCGVADRRHGGTCAQHVEHHHSSLHHFFFLSAFMSMYKIQVCGGRHRKRHLLDVSRHSWLCFVHFAQCMGRCIYTQRRVVFRFVPPFSVVMASGQHVRNDDAIFSEYVAISCAAVQHDEDDEAHNSMTKTARDFLKKKFGTISRFYSGISNADTGDVNGFSRINTLRKALAALDRGGWERSYHQRIFHVSAACSDVQEFESCAGPADLVVCADTRCVARSRF